MPTEKTSSLTTYLIRGAFFLLLFLQFLTKDFSVCFIFRFWSELLLLNKNIFLTRKISIVEKKREKETEQIIRESPSFLFVSLDRSAKFKNRKFPSKNLHIILFHIHKNVIIFLCSFFLFFFVRCVPDSKL